MFHTAETASGGENVEAQRFSKCEPSRAEPSQGSSVHGREKSITLVI